MAGRPNLRVNTVGRGESSRAGAVGRSPLSSSDWSVLSSMGSEQSPGYAEHLRSLENHPTMTYPYELDQGQTPYDEGFQDPQSPYMKVPPIRVLERIPFIFNRDVISPRWLTPTPYDESTIKQSNEVKRAREEAAKKAQQEVRKNRKRK